MRREDQTDGGVVRPCSATQQSEMLEVINTAAQAYCGAISADRWREPYMPADELTSEIADGVMFSGCEVDGGLVAVVGVRSRTNVDLILHAYVLPIGKDAASAPDSSTISGQRRRDLFRGHVAGGGVGHTLL